jgi:hypothetical protein
MGSLPPRSSSATCAGRKAARRRRRRRWRAHRRPSTARAARSLMRQPRHRRPSDDRRPASGDSRRATPMSANRTSDRRLNGAHDELNSYLVLPPVSPWTYALRTTFRVDRAEAPASTDPSTRRRKDRDLARQRDRRRPGEGSGLDSPPDRLERADQSDWLTKALPWVRTMIVAPVIRAVVVVGGAAVRSGGGALRVVARQVLVGDTLRSSMTPPPPDEIMPVAAAKGRPAAAAGDGCQFLSHSRGTGDLRHKRGARRGYRHLLPSTWLRSLGARAVNCGLGRRTDGAAG